MAYRPTVVSPYNSSKLSGEGSNRGWPNRATPPVPTETLLERAKLLYVITAQLSRPATMALRAWERWNSNDPPPTVVLSTNLGYMFR